MTHKNLALWIYTAAASVLCFGVFIFSYEIDLYGIGSWGLYTSDVLSRFADMLLPMAAAAVILPRLLSLTWASILWRTILLTLPRMFSAAPEQYLSLIDSGLSSEESVLLGLLYALAEVLILFAVYMGLFALLRYLLRRRERVTRFAEASSDNSVLLAIAVFGAPQLLFSLYIEIREIISFLVTYFTSFSVGEVLYMTGSFIFVPLSYILCLYLSFTLCIYLKKDRCPSESGK